MLLIYIDFGNFLNLAKAWMEGERKAGRINQSWGSWLKEKLGIPMTTRGSYMLLQRFFLDMINFSMWDYPQITF